MVNNIFVLNSYSTDIRNYDFVGFIGFCLYLPFSLICLYRCYYSLQEETLSLTSYKSLFHIFITCYGIIELAYLIELWVYNSIILSAFIIHQIAIVVNFLALNIAIQFFTKVLRFIDEKLEFFSFIPIISISSSIIAASFSIIVIGIFGLNCATDLCLTALILDLCTNAACLFILSLWMLILGIRLRKRISITKDVKLISKINIIFGTCVFCYFCRVFFELYNAYVEYDVDTSSFNYFYNSLLYWELCSSWIPYLVSSYLLLSLMRPKSFDHRSTSSTNNSFATNNNNNNYNSNNNTYKIRNSDISVNSLHSDYRDSNYSNGTIDFGITQLERTNTLNRDSTLSDNLDNNEYTVYGLPIQNNKTKYSREVNRSVSIDTNFYRSSLKGYFNSSLSALQTSKIQNPDKATDSIEL